MDFGVILGNIHIIKMLKLQTNFPPGRNFSNVKISFPLHSRTPKTKSLWASHFVENSKFQYTLVGQPSTKWGNPIFQCQRRGTNLQRGFPWWRVKNWISPLHGEGCPTPSRIYSLTCPKNVHIPHKIFKFILVIGNLSINNPILTLNEWQLS